MNHKYRIELEYLQNHFNELKKQDYTEYWFFSKHQEIKYEIMYDEIGNKCSLKDSCVDYITLKIMNKYIMIKYHSFYRPQMRIYISKLDWYVARKIHDLKLMEKPK